MQWLTTSTGYGDIQTLFQSPPTLLRVLRLFDHSFPGWNADGTVTSVKGKTSHPLHKGLM